MIDIIKPSSRGVPGIIRNKKGKQFLYNLERKRKWNVGLRRYEYGLTGNIVLYFGGQLTYNVYNNFKEIEVEIDKETEYE